MIFCYADWHNALWRNVRREKTGAAGSVAHAGRLEAGLYLSGLLGQSGFGSSNSTRSLYIGYLEGGTAIQGALIHNLPANALMQSPRLELYHSQGNLRL